MPDSPASDLTHPAHISFRTRFTGVFALTFDDGPNPRVTPAILLRLRELGLKATFFVVGERITRFPEGLAMALADGHALGSHFYHHLDWRGATVAQLHAELDLCQHTVDDVLGYHYPLRQVRPPYGHISDNLITVLRERQENLVLWQAGCDEKNVPDLSVDALCGMLRDHPELAGWEGILLMHDIHPQTVNLLAALVRLALERNLLPATTRQLLDAITAAGPASAR
ncbi:MAG: polysaccharide deacetylase family protein [Candidatus Sericytochromatia bacterium]|nr:polysaccharide deacetylase family protein [Candidatus Sericytochromatia bacterium]